MLDKKQCKSFLKKTLSTSISKLNELEEIKKNGKTEDYNKLLREIESLNKLLSATDEYIKLIKI